MTQIPPDSNRLSSTTNASTLETIQMTANEFRQYVDNIKSTSLQQKLLPLARVCEGSSSVNAGVNAISRPLQCSQTFTARSFFTRQKKVATTECQVSSTSSKESSQEFVLAQELELAKASGITSTFVDAQTSSHASKNYNNDNISSVGLHCHDLLSLQSPRKENAPIEKMVINNSQEQDAMFAIKDNKVLEEFKYKIEEDKEELMEEQVTEKADKQIMLTIPQASCSSDREIITSQTSQEFFTATSRTFDIQEKTSTEQVINSAGSIQAHVGSDDSRESESDYSAPWDHSMSASPSSFPTEPALTSEEMALLTEDFVLESDRVDVAMDGDAESVPESQDAVLAAIDQVASAMPMEVVVLDNDLDADDDGESGISLVNASAVLMQRSQLRSKEEVSSDDSLSSDGY